MNSITEALIHLSPLLWPLLCWMGAVILHEFGHAIVAALVGMHPFRITFGNGPRWLNIFLPYPLGLRIVWMGLPFHARVHMLIAKHRFRRTAFFFAVLAGPLTNLVVLVCCIIFVNWDGPNKERWLLFAIANGLAFLSTILPLRDPRRPLLASDGTYLQDIPRHSDGVLELMAMQSQKLSDLNAKNADENYFRLIGDPLHKPLPVDYSAGPLTPEYLAAQSLYEKLAGDPGLSSELRVQILDLIISNILFHADMARLEKALELSGELITLAPTSPTVMGTRGGVLVMAGRFEEGVPLLEQCAAEAPDDYSKAISIFYLGVAAFRRGDHDKAVEYFDQAASIDAHCPVLWQKSHYVVAER